MPEGLLSTGEAKGSYAIDSLTGVDLVSEQAIEIFLGGQWIAGHIAYNRSSSKASRETRRNEISSLVGMYHSPDDEDENSVVEASEESFPASDPPAWEETGKDSERMPHIFPGPYFVADVDGSVCGLCIGMRVRV